MSDTEHAKLSRREYLEDALRQLEATAKTAEDRESFTAAVKAKTEAVKVRAELDQLRETEQKRDAPVSPDDHKDEILAEVRRMRQGASEAGSFVAAANLLKLERELLTLAEQDRRDAKARALAAASDDDLIGEYVELLMRLPDDVRDRLAEALGAVREAG